MSNTDRYQEYDQKIDRIIAALEKDISNQPKKLEKLQSDLDKLAQEYRDDEELGTDRYKLYQGQAMLHFRLGDTQKAGTWIREAIDIKGTSFPDAEDLLDQLENDGVSVDPIYFSIPVKRLVLLGIFSFGMYQVYWFYKNFAIIREVEGENVGPVWRAVFSIFFCYGLAKRVLRSAQRQGYEGSYSPGWVAAGYIILSLLEDSQASGWGILVNLIGLFNFLPLITVQRAINYNNRHVDPDYNEAPAFYRGEKIMSAIGIAIVSLSILLQIIFLVHK